MATVMGIQIGEAEGMCTRTELRILLAGNYRLVGLNSPIVLRSCDLCLVLLGFKKAVSLEDFLRGLELV